MQMADFVMPNFDFIVGVSICFALGKRRACAPGEGRIKTACSATGKVTDRAIMLYPYSNIWHAQKEGYFCPPTQEAPCSLVCQILSLHSLQKHKNISFICGEGALAYCEALRARDPDPMRHRLVRVPA